MRPWAALFLILNAAGITGAFNVQAATATTPALYYLLAAFGVAGLSTPGAPPRNTGVGAADLAQADQVAAAVAALNVGPVASVSFVVPDLEGLRPGLEAIFGPLGEARETTLGTGTLFRGVPVAGAHMKIVDLKFAGDFKVSFVEPGKERMPQREVLDKYGPGMHHILFRAYPEDWERVRKQFEDNGFERVFEGQSDNGIRFEHYEHPAKFGRLRIGVDFNKKRSE